MTETQNFILMMSIIKVFVSCIFTHPSLQSEDYPLVHSVLFALLSAFDGLKISRLPALRLCNDTRSNPPLFTFIYLCLFQVKNLLIREKCLQHGAISTPVFSRSTPPSHHLDSNSLFDSDRWCEIVRVIFSPAKGFISLKCLSYCAHSALKAIMGVSLEADNSRRLRRLLIQSRNQITSIV